MSHKDVSKVTEDPHRFAEEFNIVIQTQQPGFSDLHQLVHMLVGEGQAQHWMRTATWENPKRPLELQPGDHPANLHDQAHAMLGDFMGQFLQLFQSLLIGTKCRLAHSNLMNLFVTINN